MKKTLLILAFVLSLFLAFSMVSFATESENTYYVVQSEESDLAASLKAEGKGVVGVDKLYSSRNDAIKEGSTYFLNQFDGKELNLILAENVSYCMGINPSDPTGSGIRLDKAITLNVYFNGNYWWIPDDGKYAGFFLANEGATLSLIGDRTPEEVEAASSLSSTVNANTTSSEVDYYAGYVGLYVQAGSLTIKNAIIIGHDEVIYQKDHTAAQCYGTSTLHFENCAVYTKTTYKPIYFKSEGKTDIKVEIDHLYTEEVAINNILTDSYINNSKMTNLFTDSWHGDEYIGKEYIYINNSIIGDYTADGDTQHPIATNTTFGKIDLNGDTTGGAYATLIDSTYKSLYLVRQTNGNPTRNGILYVVTVADCVNAATRTVYTYDDSSKTITSTLDKKYSVDNPALGHNTKEKALSITYTSYLSAGEGEYICTACDVTYTAATAPLFTCLGYSAPEGERSGISIGYNVNIEAIEAYEEVAGKTLNYGVFAVLKDRLGDNSIFSEDGKSTNGVVSADITSYKFTSFDFKIVDFKEDQKSKKLAMGVYVATKDGEVTEYTYLQSGTPNENEKYYFASYDDIINAIPDEIVEFDDISIKSGEEITLPSTVRVNGIDKEVTYSFEGENISIENNVLKGLVKGTETVVTVTGKKVTGTFKVKVEADKYKYVVIIGVDGAGAFFKDANTPNIDSIFANGAITYNCLTSDPTISAQCWGSLMHGVVPSAHGLTNSIVESKPYPTDSKYPSFFRVIRENDENAILASFCNWNPINIGIIENDIGVYKRGGISDSALTAEILAYLGENMPTALFVQFDGADGVGHSTGYGTDSQLAMISEIDGYIGQIYEMYKQNGMLDETLFIVTSDHGGTGTNHGGLTDAEKYVMFAATGKNVQKGTIEDMEIRDTAAVVLHALGYENPETWTARVPSGLFEGVTAGSRPVYVDKDADRYHESEPTPEVGSDRYVTNYIKDHELNAYLTFDGSVSDNCGGETVGYGSLTYEDGYFGQGVALDNGYVSIKNFAPGTSSFTVSLWINTDKITSDPCVFSNKDWYTGKNTGFAFSIRKDNGGDVRWNFGKNGGDRVDCDVLLPSDYSEGWMHIIAFVDQKNNKLGLCLDFGTIVSVDIPENMRISLDTQYNCMNIGQDGTGKYGSSLPAIVDEFMIFDGAFDQSDVDALKEYYGLIIKG